MKLALLLGVALGWSGCAKPPPSTETAAVPALPELVTFSDHIAPIMRDNCAECHNPDGIGPFSLLTYRQVSSRSRQIEEVTESRFMPPWKPAHGYGPELDGKRRLSDRDIALIRTWHDTGASAGDGPQSVDFNPPDGGWELGPPDLVMELPEPFLLPADGLDIYRNFVMLSPFSANITRYVRAVEFQPQARLAIHHAQIAIDASDWSRQRDAEDEGPGFTGMEFGNNENPGGNFVGWTPGQVPFESIPGAAWAWEHGTNIIARLHLAPTGKVEKISPRIGLYFTDEAPTRITDIISISTQQIDIPAGEANYWAEESLTLPVPVEVVGIFPHAHYIGKDLEIFANLPHGDKQELLHIPDWDFFWQQTYQFSKPVHLPAGAEIVMRYRYDNSAENIRNPFSPPRRITLGWNSTDEMGEVELSVLLASKEDQRALKKTQNEFARRQLGDAHYFFTIGMEHMTAGQTEKAAEFFERALQVDPTFQQAVNNLGVVEERRGNFEQARERYQTARELDPTDRQTLQNLYRLLDAKFSRNEADGLLRGHLETNPHDEAIRLQLVDSLLATGKISDGFALLQKGLELRPVSAPIHFRLGIIYREANEITLAQRHLLRAANNTGENSEHRELRADAFYALALISLEQGQPADLSSHLQNVLAQNPDHRSGRLLTAAIALHQNNHREALPHLEFLLSLPPTKQLSPQQWVGDLPFPSGVILVANLMQDRDQTTSARELIEFALTQARNANNQTWVAELTHALGDLSTLSQTE